MLLGPTLAAVSLTLSDASTAEVRSVPSGDEVAFDVSTAPSALLGLTFRRSAWTSLHAAHCCCRPDRDAQLAVFHDVQAGYAWWARRLRLSFGVRGSIGRQSFLSAAEGRTTRGATSAPAASGPGDGGASPAPNAAGNGLDDPFLAQQEVVETAGAGASFDLGYSLSPRWSLGLGIGYDVAGGINESEPFIPFRRTALASASLTHNLTRRDDLTTVASFTVTDVPSRDSRFITLSALETWSHRFAPRYVGSVGAGATYLRHVPQQMLPPKNSLLATGATTINQLRLVRWGNTQPRRSLDLGHPLQSGARSREPALSAVASALWQSERPASPRLGRRVNRCPWTRRMLQ
jgi:hypothetical protein